MHQVPNPDRFVDLFRPLLVRESDCRAPSPDPPSTRLPSTAPDAQATVRSSLSTLLHLLLASPSLRRLLADLALLLRDLLRLQLESVQQNGNMQERTQESLVKVVDKAAEKAVGQEELVKHDLEGQEGLEGGKVGPDLKPEQGAEEIRDKIMDRLKEVSASIKTRLGARRSFTDSQPLLSHRWSSKSSAQRPISMRYKICSSLQGTISAA
jgi:hypothetical protein